MTYEEKYRYWEMISDYDIGTAHDMINAERWMYVASICYSAVARLLKGLIVYGTHKEAPKSDNLIFLASRICESEEFMSTPDGIRFKSEKTEYFDIMADITFYHISDYPFSYQKMTDRFIGKETAQAVFDATEKLILWFKTFAPEKQDDK